MPLQNKMPGTADIKRNSWGRGNGPDSRRGELRHGLSMEKKNLNRKVRHYTKENLQHGDYKRVCRSLYRVRFS